MSDLLMRCLQPGQAGNKYNAYEYVRGNVRGDRGLEEKEVSRNDCLLLTTGEGGEMCPTDGLDFICDFAS